MKPIIKNSYPEYYIETTEDLENTAKKFLDINNAVISVLCPKSS